MTKRDEWVRVKSESELLAGMCVEIRPCRECGKKDRFFLAIQKDHRTCLRCNVSSGRAFKFIGNCFSQGFCCPCRPIEEGRLYRLADSQLTESEATRELESAR